MRPTWQSAMNGPFVHNDPLSTRKAGTPKVLELMQTRLSEGSINSARLLTCCRVKSKETLWIEMQFDKQIFSLEQIDILLQQFRHTIQQLLHASTPLADLEPVRRYEKSLLLGINKKSFSQVSACIQDQIRDVAREQPAAPAICSWDSDLDHEELNDLSCRVATLLQQHGVKAGMMVPYSAKSLPQLPLSCWNPQGWRSSYWYGLR